jgi:uncharacterized repeat protein (TIGR03803 family)
MDSAGNLYGATVSGGASGAGMVYKLAPGDGGWEQSVLYSFQGRPDGSAPYATPILDAAGNLYGTTNAGPHNLGTVYMLAPQADGSSGLWNKHVLHAFAGGEDGAYPLAGGDFRPVRRFVRDHQQRRYVGLRDCLRART